VSWTDKQNTGNDRHFMLQNNQQIYKYVLVFRLPARSEWELRSSGLLRSK